MWWLLISASVLPFLIPFLLTLVFVPLVIKLYHHYGWDRPHRGQRQNFKDTHRGLVPRGGGLAIFLGLTLTIFIWICLQPTAILTNWVGVPAATFPSITPQILAILAGTALLALSGVLDDICDLSPLLRLGLNVLAASFLVSTGLTINFVTNPFAPGVWEFAAIPWLPPILTIIYVVALTNITNWAKGVDGQMPGVVIIAAVIIAGVSLRLSGDFNFIWLLAMMVTGSFAGFLVWNFYPQKIMPCYGGGALAGFLLAVLSIMAGAKIATLFMAIS